MSNATGETYPKEVSLFQNRIVDLENIELSQ